MARRNSSTSKVGSALLSIVVFFALIFGVVLGVAGIKYVVEGGLDGDSTSLPGTSTSIPPTTTSEEPTTTEEPITSEDPVTSEEPITSVEPPTSEEPEPVLLYGDFPSKLFDGPYSDFALPGETRIVINLDPSIKPDTIAANAYGTYLNTATKGYYQQAGADTTTAVDFNISANSMRYDNTTLGYKMGFSDTTLASDVYVDPVFYQDKWGASYTYTSVIVFDFSFTSEAGYSLEIGNAFDTGLSMFYRTNNDLTWRVASESDINYFGIDDYGLQGEEQMQIAVAYQTNSKSNNIVFQDIKLSLVVAEPAPDYNAEQVYRIMSTTNFVDEENFGYWEVLASGFDGTTRIGLEKNGYFYVDLKVTTELGDPYVILAIHGMAVADYAIIDAPAISPGVNIIEFTYEEATYGYNFFASVVENRPFVASDY